MSKTTPDKSLFVGIIGTDGYVPTYQDTARWTTYEYDECYWGDVGLNKFVPKIGDHIRVKGTTREYVVDDLNLITFVPIISAVTRENDIDPDGLIAYSDQNWLLHYDKSHYPFTICPDAMITVNIDEASYARIYRGIAPVDSQLLSMVYNNSGNFVTHDVKLESSIDSGYDIRGIKGVPSCNTNVELKDGETCLLVIFNSSGKVLNSNVLRVNETTYVTGAFTNRRMISNIYMKSAFIEDIESRTINFPVNLTSESFQPIGVVVYNDGTTEEHIVDGSKFILHGAGNFSGIGAKGSVVNSFASQTPGTKIDLVLAYNKDPNVGTLMDQGVDPNVVSVPYEMILDQAKRSYGVKLFAYPVWVDEINGYRLRYWIANLDRNLMTDVTSEVGLAVNSDPFYPKAYGYTQRITVMLDLSRVSATYNHFIHTQTIDITLRDRANNDLNENIWEVGTQTFANIPYYGEKLKAVLTGDGNDSVDITNGFKSAKEFLENTYERSGPLYDPLDEPEFVEPTHMLVKHLNDSKHIPIKDFNKLIKFNHALKYYDNITIVFTRQIPGKHLFLSVVEMTIRK